MEEERLRMMGECLLDAANWEKEKERRRIKKEELAKEKKDKEKQNEKKTEVKQEPIESDEGTPTTRTPRATSNHSQPQETNTSENMESNTAPNKAPRTKETQEEEEPPMKQRRHHATLKKNGEKQMEQKPDESDQGQMTTRRPVTRSQPREMDGTEHSNANSATNKAQPTKRTRVKESPKKQRRHATLMIGDDQMQQTESHRCTADGCDVSFSTAAYLKAHIDRCNGADRKHQCQQCLKRFAWPSVLKRHVDSVHLKAEQREHLCPRCPLAFDCASKLNRHLRVHTGERPFTCDECGGVFTRASSLRTHKRIHTSETPYRCDECGKCFTRSSHLRRHLDTHLNLKPYQCHICDKRFTRNGDVKRHQRRLHASI